MQKVPQSIGGGHRAGIGMLVKVITLSGFLVGAGVGLALSQTAGPAELPPSDYQGQSYIDSQGCIFLKATFDGDTNWVPRVGQDRKPICGQTPTQAVVNVTSAAAEAKAVPPRQTRATNRVARAVEPRRLVKIGCPVSVPVARRYATTDGGSVVLCTAANGSLTGARSPIYPPGSGVGAALSPTQHAGVAIPLGKGAGQIAQGKGEATFTPPKGYEVAWKDGRLNPLRAKGTAAGQAAQDKIWTRDVPAVAVVGKTKAKPATQTTISASNGSGAISVYVQVGAFGDPSNAIGAAARLSALGLPVTKSKSGKALQVVYAGPFASGSDAKTALNVARSNGFSDAFIK